jgi:proteasome lid subunit RPN8/RPN11
MAKPAKVKIRVSTQPVVVMEAEVLRKIRQHARTSMKAEVCGVLIGNTEHERMTVEACIAGINAAQGGAHVTFTQDTWEHIYKIKDKDFPEHKIVGWYHSHPGFGVFLSEHDLFIQQNFFSNPQQVAWVFDPHTDEEGCFGWIGGNIEKLSDIRVGYTQSVEITESTANDYEDDDEDMATDAMARASQNQLSRNKQRSQEPEWMKWAILTVGCSFALLLGFVLGWFVLSRKVASAIDGIDQVEKQLGRDEQFIEMLQQHPEIFTPGVYSTIFGRPSQPAGAASQPQPSLQQSAPAQTPDNKGSDKGNNGKH